MSERHPRDRAALLVLHDRGRHRSFRRLRQLSSSEVHCARLDELPPRALLGILAVRQAVFIVEQNCVYTDIDNLDADAATRHLWIEDEAGNVVSTLRLMAAAGGGHRIGRVATLPKARGRGHAAMLIRQGIELSGPPIMLSAQAHLVDWYAGFGFVEQGERWIEDGIEHAPMRLDVSP